MNYKKLQKLVNQAFINYQKNNNGITMSEFAQAHDIPYSNMYSALKGKRKVNAEIYFDIMDKLGAVEMSSNGLFLRSA